MIPGSQPRRTILKAGLGGFASLSLADVLRLQNQSQASESRTAASERTAVILVWLRGGASHLETFDPKPQATLEFRGPYSPIDTNVPGIQICELLPRLSTIADRYSILRSIAHTGGGHPAGSLQVLAGDPDPLVLLLVTGRFQRLSRRDRSAGRPERYRYSGRRSAMARWMDVQQI